MNEVEVATEGYEESPKAASMSEFGKPPLVTFVRVKTNFEFCLI